MAIGEDVSRSGECPQGDYSDVYYSPGHIVHNDARVCSAATMDCDASAGSASSAAACGVESENMLMMMKKKKIKAGPASALDACAFRRGDGFGVCKGDCNISNEHHNNSNNYENDNRTYRMEVRNSKKEHKVQQQQHQQESPDIVQHKLAPARL
eukprot:Nk52_evm27s2391 gene=Nk52_evmTU27s2391